MHLLKKIDLSILNTLRRIEVPLARLAIFVVYFWFGALKLLGVSPAGPLVQELFDVAIISIPFPAFYMAFAIFEMIIGLAFLVRGWERVAIFLLMAHLATAALPLIVLPHITWQGFLVPTIEGQYIIKNILIAALAIVIGSRLAPLRDTHI